MAYEWTELDEKAMKEGEALLKSRSYRIRLSDKNNSKDNNKENSDVRKRDFSATPKR
jgi:hypothetical protein